MCEVRAHCVRVRASFSLRLFVCLHVFCVFCPHVRMPLFCVSVSGCQCCVSVCSYLRLRVSLRLLTRTAPAGHSVEGR